MILWKNKIYKMFFERKKFYSAQPTNEHHTDLLKYCFAWLIFDPFLANFRQKQLMQDYKQDKYDFNQIIQFWKNSLKPKKRLLHSNDLVFLQHDLQIYQSLNLERVVYKRLLFWLIRLNRGRPECSELTNIVDNF